MSEPARVRPAASVVVVGGGFSGVAAAWSATREGGRVLVVLARAGASELYSGVLDGEPPSSEVAKLAGELGLVTSALPRAIATREGSVRGAYGRDAALLDLEAFEGRTIAVADVGRDEWDGELLARSFASSAWARRTNTRFRAVSVAALKSGAERRIGPYDFACALETPERIAGLGQQLAEAGAGVDAWLLGPWLGVHTNLAERLTRAAGIPVGETASAPGGVAGARFALRRSALFERAGIEHQVRSVRAVAKASGRPVVTLDDGTEITARAIVLAVGGVVGGGIALGAPGAAKALVASLDAPVEVLLGNRGDDGAGWLNGPSFERLGLRALESLGILVDKSLAVATDFPLYVAGDALARQPKTAIAALASGIEAGLRAVRAV